MNELKSVVIQNAKELETLQEDNQGNETAIETLQNDISLIKQNNTAQDNKIKEIEDKNSEQDTNIKTNQEDIKALQEENAEVKAENERLKNDINSISLVGQAEGESIDLNDSSNARFNKFEIGGNHKQDGTPSIENPFEIKTVGENVNLLDVDETTYDTNINLQKEGKYLKGNDVNLIRIGSLNNSTPEIEERLEVGNYTVSYEIETNANITIQNLFLCIIYEDNTQENIGNGISYSIEKGIKAKVFWTIDVTKVAKKIGVVSYLSSSCDVILSNIKLEKGSKATSYSKYGQGSIEVKVVNNDNTQKQIITMPVQQEMLKGDYFDFDREKEVHVMKKLVLQGIETENRWTVVGNTETEWRFLISAEGILRTLSSTEIANIICNKLKTTSSDNIYLKETGISGDDKYDAMIIYIEECKEMTVSEFNVYLKQQYDAGTPFIIYYKLATPIEFDFTDEQKAVAKQIKESLHTYKNVTHIYSDDEVSPILNAEYAKDLNTVINNIQLQEK